MTQKNVYKFLIEGLSSVSVPKQLIYDGNLTHMERLLLMAIIERGPDTGDGELALLFNVDRSRIRRLMKSLDDKGYITREGKTSKRVILIEKMMGKYDSSPGEPHFFQSLDVKRFREKKE